MEATMMRSGLTLAPILERCAKLNAQREIVSRLPDGSLHRYHYADFYARAHAATRSLLAAGLKPGDRVATLMWNSYRHLECYFAIPLAGGVIHTLNLRLHPDQIAYILNHGGARWLVVDDVLLPLYDTFKHKVQMERVIVAGSGDALGSSGYIDYEDFIAHGGQAAAPPVVDEWQAAAMCYTSGTTGEPKGVVYSHRAIVLHSFAISLPDAIDISQRDVTMPIVPMFHANAWGLPYAATMLGSKQVFPGPRLDAESLLGLIEREGVTLAAGVPTILLSVLDKLERNPKCREHAAPLRAACGGAAPPESLIRSLEAFGISILHAWGMTEMTPVGTANFLKAGLETEDLDRAYARRVKQGVPVPFVDLRIRANGVTQPWDGATNGEVEVRGPWIAAGYHNNQNAAEQWTEDGWFRTGDIATVDEHGYVHITDRIKDLIRSGGEWISSLALENALVAHPAVHQAAVVAVPHPKWQERPLAVIVLKEDRHVGADELRAYLAARFARIWVPDGFVFVDALPHTSTGKIFKAELRQQYKDWVPR